MMRLLWYWLMQVVRRRNSMYAVLYAHSLEKMGDIEGAYDALCLKEHVKGFQPNFWFCNNLGCYAMNLYNGSNPTMLKVAEDAFGKALELDPQSDLLKANMAKLQELIKNSPAPLPEEDEKPDSAQPSEDSPESGPEMVDDSESLDDFFEGDDKAEKLQDKKPSPPQDESNGKGTVPVSAGKKELPPNVRLGGLAIEHFIEVMVDFVKYFKAEIGDAYAQQLMEQIQAFIAESRPDNEGRALERAVSVLCLAGDLLETIKSQVEKQVNKGQQPDQNQEQDDHDDQQGDGQADNKPAEPPQEPPSSPEEMADPPREMVDPPLLASDPKQREMIDPPPRPPRAKTKKVK